METTLTGATDAAHGFEATNWPAGVAIELLYQSVTTRIFRLRWPTGASMICKERLGPHAQERLRHESAILARLAGIEGVSRLAPAPHPGAVMALEDCGGVPLAQAIGAAPMAISGLLDLALQLAHIVAAVHRRGVLHQNINPANILLCGAQRLPVLIDFDLASALSDGQTSVAHHRDLPGALAYLAPEQSGRTGHAVDQRTDLYALGATLYELATGHLPFEEPDPLQLIHDHLVRLPTPPAKLQAGLPWALSDLILRLLEKEPERRYQSAEGLAHDLSRLCQAQAHGRDMPLRLGERDFPLRLLPPARPVGRETEIGALHLAFEHALRGSGNVALVAGAPGIGKTSLINELRPLVIARHGWFVSGKFDQYRHDAPSATAQALRALGRLLLAEAEAELAQLRERIRSALGVNAGVITAIIPEFALLLGAQPEVAAIDPAEVEARLRLTVLDMLRAIASPTRPLVMVLDDLQWANGITIRFIDNAMSDGKLPGLLMVGAYRGAEVDATHPLSAMLARWERLDPGPLQLQLQNLSPPDLGTLLAQMLRLAPARAAQLAQALGAHTGGNPYDTLELVNALRRDGALVPRADGWDWDAATVRHYIGQGNVIDLLHARVAQLPAPGRALLEAMACLGGAVGPGQLAIATGLAPAELERHQAAPLEDGLLERGDDGALRLRHDRVQQAVYGALEPARRRALHLILARRLAQRPEFGAAAAEQYLPAIEDIHDADECRQVAGLFHLVATHTRRVTNYAAAERFLTAAMRLLSPAGGGVADAAALTALETDRHAVLYCLGRLEEADLLYRSIEGHCADPMDLLKPACVQVSSLTNRGLPREAVTLGLALLRQLGLPVPPAHSIGAEVARRLDALYQWVTALSEADDRHRPEAVDPRGVALAALMNRLMAPARLCDPMIVAWLVLESQRRWAEHGPCAKLAPCLGHATLITIALRQDYRSGYETVRHVLATSQARGYAPETSQVRDLFALSSSHWFEALENSVAAIRDAREELLHRGDLQGACFTYYVSVTALLDCAPTLESYASEVEAGLAFAIRTGNDHGTDLYLMHRQLLRSLRGQTRAPGSLADDDYDEADRLVRLGRNPSADATFHLIRALAAACFGDMTGLIRHTAALWLMRSYLQSFYATALVYLLQALALAQRAKAAAGDARVALCAELDACRAWLAQRAADAPGNFGHLQKLVEAECAWVQGDYWTASCAFDQALREVAARQRPWHHALISERAALLHLAHGQEHTGRTLLAEARNLYDAWGASAKARELERSHAFLRVANDSRRRRDCGDSGVGADIDIDMLALLRASQALSSETSLDRLKARVGELLAAMTGATTVLLALWHADVGKWMLPSMAGEAHADAAPAVSVEQAGMRGLLPLSVFRYAERTLEPLLLEDATSDDRFARDPYVAGLERCSLLVVPILSQGAPRAMLLLENRLSRGAFSADRLDAVMLIAGQLAVSLENALLYQELEERVQQRTRELRETQTELVGTARRAGMAEIATNVLHNVGNILNSVNVSASIVSSRLRASKSRNLTRAVQLMDEHSADLGHFLSHSEQGKMLPGYLGKLAQTLQSEQQSMIEELDNLNKNIEHIKNVVATQQAYAGNSSVRELVQIHELVEDALRINDSALSRHQVTLVTEFAEVPAAALDKTRIMQILVNLIGNAKQAMEGVSERAHRLTIQVGMAGNRLRVCIKDDGAGISAENLTRIFSHGFTTRSGGHGFGLHSCALAAGEMGGTLAAHSDGPGTGASFTLELPLDAPAQNP